MFLSIFFRENLFRHYISGALLGGKGLYRFRGGGCGEGHGGGDVGVVVGVGVGVSVCGGGMCRNRLTEMNDR